MASNIRVIGIDGLDKAIAKLTPERANGPIGRFLDRGAIYIQSRARENAPVDRNTLRNSIGVKPVSPRMREIGPNMEYARYVEEGTRPHWPPPGALAGWAKRHGMEEDTIRYIIGMYGTKPHPYMKPAAEDSEGFVKGLLPVLASELEQEYGNG